MMNATVRFGAYCLIAAALASAPTRSIAQETPATAEKVENKESRAVPFNGKLKAVDPSARTITFGSTTLQVDDHTKIVKHGQPAALGDAVVGEMVAGTYRKESGKATAILVRFGPKNGAQADAKADKP
ncbi:MAG TPA: hypothetical protein VEH04_19510 [Verrucomicrobiae bacterium]|nr:hypothetical protein [Verrucomicrobiae bacterium]